MNPISIVGCGFLGKKLAAELQQAGVAFSCMVASEVSSKTIQQKGWPVTRVDLDSETQQKNLEGLHESKCLLYTVPPPRDGIVDGRVTTLIKQLDQHGHPEKVVYISTTAVYADSHGEWIDEECATQPATERGKRRLDAERQWQQWCDKHNIPLVILRVVGIYSPDRLPVASIEAQRPVIREEEAGYSNRIHVDDLVHICQAMLLGDYQGIFNVSDGNPTSMSDYFNHVADYLDLPRPPQISREEAEKRLSPEMLSYINESKRISVEKLKKELAYTFIYPNLAMGLKRPKG